MTAHLHAAAPGATDGAPARGDRRTWLVVHLCTLVAAVPLLFWINRNQWFAGDEWEVITKNGLGSSAQQVSDFAPHFEHWSTLVVLVYRSLFAVFELHTYVPYVAVMIVVILAVTHLSVALPRAGGGHARVRHRGRARLHGARCRVGEPVDRMADNDRRSDRARARRAAGDARAWCVRAPRPRRVVAARRRADVLRRRGDDDGRRRTRRVPAPGLAGDRRRSSSIPVVVYGTWYLFEGRQGQRGHVALSTAFRELPDFVWSGLTGALERPDPGSRHRHRSCWCW